MDGGGPAWSQVARQRAFERAYSDAPGGVRSARHVRLWTQPDGAGIVCGISIAEPRPANPALFEFEISMYGVCLD
jgi:hypothetical protein